MLFGDNIADKQEHLFDAEVYRFVPVVDRGHYRETVNSHAA
jgi:hypothetical protein